MKMDFAFILKFQRQRLGLTQAQLAKKARTSQQLIAKYEAGESEPRFSNAMAILKILGADIAFTKTYSKISCGSYDFWYPN